MFDVPFCEFDKNFKFETIDENYENGELKRFFLFFFCFY